MAQITAMLRPGSYAPRHDWVIALDGLAFDEWLADSSQDRHYVGLVPALANLADPDEAAIAWQRMLPLAGCSTLAPLLICPQHLDFSCVVVLAEVLHQGDSIFWRRFGLNYVSSATPEDLGECVEWLPGLESVAFDKADYLACLERFHLLRLDQTLGLEGKTFAVLLESPEPRTLLRGTARLSPSGLILEPESGPSFEIRSSWLTRIRPVEPDLRELCRDAEWVLALGPAEMAPTDLSRF